MFKQKRQIQVDGDVAYVELTQGQWSIIDVVDIPLVSQRNWCASYNTSIGSYYVTSKRRKDEEGSRTIYLHRFLTGASSDKVVDHINHNTLDNRRDNLRVCTNWQNNQNRKGIDPRSTTGVRG